MAETLQPAKPGRLMSLDVFRVFTIAAMLLVNNAGDWSHVWEPLGHADWHGCTATDLIFPFFLFIMGAAMQFSFAGRLSKSGGHGGVIGQIIRRTVILFALGVILNCFSWWSYANHFRLYGVLQRIAICYFVCSFIMLYGSTQAQIIWCVGFLAVYYIIMKFVRAPGQPAPSLEPFKSIMDYVDSKLFKGWNYQYDADLNMWHDPEGLISTLGAFGSTLAGGICGWWLRKKEKSTVEKTAGILAVGVLLIIAGKLMKHDIPLNKHLWTPSYVVYTSGAALLCLGACCWLIDVKGWRTWAKPFMYYGMNAIASYFGASAMAIIIAGIKLQIGADEFIRLKGFIYNNFYKSWIPNVAGEYVCSAAYGATFVLIWCVVAWLLYRKKIFIKV